MLKCLQNKKTAKTWMKGVTKGNNTRAEREREEGGERDGEWGRDKRERERERGGERERERERERDKEKERERGGRGSAAEGGRDKREWERS